MNGYVSCVCSTWKQKKILRALGVAGAFNIQVGMFNLSIDDDFEQISIRY